MRVRFYRSPKMRACWTIAPGRLNPIEINIDNDNRRQISPPGRTPEEKHSPLGRGCFERAARPSRLAGQTQINSADLTFIFGQTARPHWRSTVAIGKKKATSMAADMRRWLPLPGARHILGLPSTSAHNSARIEDCWGQERRPIPGIFRLNARQPPPVCTDSVSRPLA